MLFILDWDGTLSNSAEKIVSCVQDAASALALPVQSEMNIKNIIGLGLPEAVLTLYPHFDAPQVQTFSKKYSEIFTERDKNPSEFFPEVMETLESLKDRGNKLAIATGKSRRGLNRVLNNLKLENFFHATRCADETESKPSPLMLHELMDEMKVDVSLSVMVGDTEWDMEMAKRAGMKKIAVNYGAHSPQRLQACSPELAVDRFSELLTWQF